MDDQKIGIAVAQIEKQFGKGSIIQLGNSNITPWASISTGALTLDKILGIGGLPRGRVIEIYGPESCLSRSTFVQYEVRTSDGKRQNHKGGSIENLYARFHGIKKSGKGHYQRSVSVGSEFWAPSMNEEGRIVQNLITDVVSTGEKECFKIKTFGGFTITATADHKFFTGSGFTRLGDLSDGDMVFIHNNTPFSKEHSSSTYRQELLVKHHPTAPTKTVGGKHVYHRISVARATLEAHNSDMDYDVYVKSLNAGIFEGINFLDPNLDVHHKDENHENNDPSNLVAISSTVHGQLHASNRHNNLRYTALPERIESIIPVGMIPTYDLKMLDPYNNYVANKFVVHNSGKSTLALSVVAQAQKLGEACVYVDVENALDPGYMSQLGVDLDRLWLSQPTSGEEALDIVEMMTKTGEVGVIVVDSVAALVPQAELDGDMTDNHVGRQARLMAQAMRKLTKAVAETNTILIFINQLRMKIGIMFGNPETQPGGMSLKYYSSVRLDIRRKEDIKNKAGEAIGIRSRVKTIKNKMAPALKQCEFDIIYGKGISDVGCIADLAIERDLIQKSGAWFSYGESKNVAQGRDQLLAFLSEIENIAKLLREQILND